MHLSPDQPQGVTAADRFEQAAAAKAADLRHRAILKKNIGTYDAAVARGKSRYANWPAARARAGAIKWHTINHLDQLLEQFERNLLANGGQIHWAETGAEAADYIVALARRRGVQKVVKAKSMVTEEIHLNTALTAAGLQPIETDLGEFICQLRGESPYHIITPVMHLQRADIAATFHEKFGTPAESTAEDLAGIARTRLRQEFLTAQMGVSGANFLVADTGQVALTSNEGNARLSSSCPPIHVVIAGIEKLVPRFEDLALFWPLLATSGTGQALTVYNTLIGGPRRDSEPDGPAELHVILLDNGRTKLLADAEQRDALHCIRCGACLNGCPVYRNIGGHSYGTTYQGPIGSVITPHLRGAEFDHLAYASSLCGNCTEVCPVGIPLHHHLLHNRRNSVARQHDRLPQRLGFRLWVWAMRHPQRFAAVGALARWALRRGLVQRWARPWTATRDLPAAPRLSFRQWWSERQGS